MFGLALIYGFLAAAAALLLQVFGLVFLDTSFVMSLSVILLLSAATVEEAARLVFFLQLAKHHPTATSYIHAFFFGLGFIAAEFSLLALSATGLPAYPILIRLALIHLLGTFFVYIGIRLRDDYPFAPLIGLIIAILSHTLYNHSL